MAEILDEKNVFQGDADLHRIMAHIDPNRMGHVPFEAFLDFMTAEHADNDTVEQMIDSFKILASGKPFITAEARHQIFSGENISNLGNSSRASFRAGILLHGANGSFKRPFSPSWCIRLCYVQSNTLWTVISSTN